MADQPDTTGIDVVAGAQQVDGSFNVADPVVEGGLQVVAGGPADAPIVEAQRGDSGSGQMVCEHGEHPEATEVGVPVLFAATADHDDRGVSPVALGEGQVAG